MAKKNNTSFSGGNMSLTDLLGKFDNDAEIIEDSSYAKIDEWIPTGSYILNATISGSLFRGMPNRRSICLAGESGSGKTYIALSICRHAIEMGYSIIYCDSEGAVDIETVQRIGVDTSKFVIKPVGTVEEFANFSANLVKTLTEAIAAGVTPPKIMVVLDSLGNLASNKEKNDVVEGTGKRDMTKQQLIRSTFRVVGNDFSKLGVPFIINNHTYEVVGSYIPTKAVSGGGGITYNASVILMLSKSKLEDKEAEEAAKKRGIEMKRTGIIVNVDPHKQRFAKPIKSKMHISFFKQPNPYVGLEPFINWESCGVCRGKLLEAKAFEKLSPAEQSLCYTKVNSKTGVTQYVFPKDTVRTLVCRHLDEEVPVNMLFTDTVLPLHVLQELDENIIRPTFELPAFEDISADDDIDEIAKDINLDEIGTNVE
ncbi:MAG: hypothetical protein ACRDD8_09680 [Bacteroidales bacterium]